MRCLLAFLLLSGPAVADGCPAAPDLTAKLDPLYEALKIAPDADTAQLITNKMWRLYDDAPDAPAQEILNEGMQARAAFDLLVAKERFDTLILYCPEYAEGYNQRAFVFVLGGDYAAALPDLERALALNPRHIGSLSGYALTLMALGREDEGQRALRAALEVHPWLPERRFLAPFRKDEL
ncbi:tetratricopeptide repeat protein [Sagittula salina]|uniref:Tetratricopeptide repeat protein n=1 Tax=Sagittula salina TaxID=2820268 RepID=A0A940MLA8_9RHOB|nr:tetratricopeptide repeat protein [Sagittula salina]MBP0483596.1 tetratricopeptide repeat protein [Sagittula salina]